MRLKMVNCKAQIAANSGTIGKICNAAIDDFKLIDAVHDLIRGSLIVGFAEMSVINTAGGWKPAPLPVDDKCLSGRPGQGHLILAREICYA